MIAELVLKIGDSTSIRGGKRWASRDGQCVVVRAPGIRILPADYAAWIRADAAPPGWETLDAAAQGRCSRYRQKVYLQEVLGIVVGSQGLSESYQRGLALGMDTSHGHLDLQHFGVLMVDLAPQEMRDLRRPLEERVGDRDIIYEKREFRCPYEVVVSSRTRDEWRDRGRRVEVNRRATPLTLEDLQVQQYDKSGGGGR